MGGAEDDESLEVFGVQKAFILKQGNDGVPVRLRDQPGDLFQLEEEVRRAAADRGAFD